MKDTVQVDFNNQEVPDLDFKLKDTRVLTHGLHPYPARMIPDLASYLIERCSLEGDTVLDPFCGSGTVLVESLINSRHAIGTDVNPFALLLAKVKTTSIANEKLKDINETLIPKISKARINKDYLKNEYVAPEFSLDINYWFHDYVIKDLAFIRDEVIQYSQKEHAVNDFLKICFTATVREVSNSRKREFKRYRMPPKDLCEYKPDVLQTFTRQVEKSIKLMNNFNEKYEDKYQSTTLKQDARKLDLPYEVDAIITSPPYGDSNTTVAYGQFSSLLMEWIGMNHGAWKKIDVEGLGGEIDDTDFSTSPSKTFIEAYPKICEKNPGRGESLKAFVLDYYESIKSMYKTVKSGGQVAIVIGDRTVSGIKIKNDAITKELAELAGFSHIETMGRRILFKTLPYKTIPLARAGSTELVKAIGREHVIILQKD
jgi:DNA modification methylase